MGESATNNLGLSRIQQFRQNHQDALPEVRVSVEENPDQILAEEKGHIRVRIGDYSCRYKLSLKWEKEFLRRQFGLFQLRQCKGEPKGKLPRGILENMSMGTKIRDALFTA